MYRCLVLLTSVTDFFKNMLTNINAVFLGFPPQTLFSGYYGFPDARHPDSCLLLVLL